MTRRHQWEADLLLLGEAAAWHLLMEQVEPELTVRAALLEANGRKP